jgi:hypothetical protein
MTQGGDVGITSGAARMLNPKRVRRGATEQKLVMPIPAMCWDGCSPWMAW